MIAHHHETGEAGDAERNAQEVGAPEADSVAEVGKGGGKGRGSCVYRMQCAVPLRF